MCAEQAECGGDEKGKGILALFNLMMPLKLQKLSGTRTKSGVLYRDVGLDAVMASA